MNRETANQVVEVVLTKLSGWYPVGNVLEGMSVEAYDKLEKALTDAVERKLDQLGVRANGGK